MANETPKKLRDDAMTHPSSPALPMIVTRGPITKDPMDMTSVTFEAGVEYRIDDQGVVRDAAGRTVCQIQIYRTFPAPPNGRVR